MISGLYPSGVTTLSQADTYISDNTVANQMPVCLICASTKDTLKVEISDDGGSTWTTIADLDASVYATFDWMWYITKPVTQVKLTGTGFVRVQGDLVAVV